MGRLTEELAIVTNEEFLKIALKKRINFFTILF